MIKPLPRPSSSSAVAWRGSASAKRAGGPIASARWALALLVSLALSLLGSPARAHDFSAGVLSMVERDDGSFDVAWTEPVDASGAPGGVALRFPAPCALASTRLSCSPPGLAGPIRFEGMHAARMQVVVRIQWRDGAVTEGLVTGKDPSFEVKDRARRSAWAWVRLGVEHIGTGYDHLAFLVGLVLLVGLDRRLVATITAFTVAHSISLALAVTGLLVAPSAPVEATIAASVVLVAWEATIDRATLSHRFPWVVALAFGLVHGLGFASALTEASIPQGGVGFALFFFNVGIELAQLALVGLLFALSKVPAVARAAHHPRAKQIACYALGTLGVAWTLDRAAALLRLTGSS